MRNENSRGKIHIHEIAANKTGAHFIKYFICNNMCYMLIKGAWRKCKFTQWNQDIRLLVLIYLYNYLRGPSSYIQGSNHQGITSF